MKKLDDIMKWQIERLAENGGFSDRYIASYVFGAKLSRVTDKMLNQVRSYRTRQRKMLTHWRNGLSALAMAHAKTVSSPTRKRKVGTVEPLRRQRAG